MAGKIEGNRGVQRARETQIRVETAKTANQTMQRTAAASQTFGNLPSSPTGFQEKIGTDTKVVEAKIQTAAPKNTTFDYNQIRGVKNNPNVTPEFIKGVESMSKRLGAKPEHIMAAMSFETGGTFSPKITNRIGATGLIQVLPTTAPELGTTTEKLRNMSSVEQLPYVEKYLEQHSRGKTLDSLEAVYTSILSGSPKSPDSVLFNKGTIAYTQNPLDWNKDGQITAREATTVVSANLFGGVKAVQQRLVDLGFVAKDKIKGFTDGSWGTNTTNAIADFQQSRGLPQTGLIDESTGFGLFGGAPSVPDKPTNPDKSTNTGGTKNNYVPNTLGLERGNRGENVKTLQDGLLKLGHLTKDQVNTGYGIFGPKTEAAVESFQKKNNLQITGKFDAATQEAMRDVFDGVGRKNQNPPVVRGAQDELIKRGYITKSEIGKGYGTFGPKTENAIKRFQADNNITQTGKLGPRTYNALLNSKNIADKKVPEVKNGSPSYSTATDGKYYNVNQGILMTDSLKPKLENLAQKYFEITGQKLHVTSGYRPPTRQAAAMYDNMMKPNGVATTRGLYSDKGAVNEIIDAFQANPGNREAAVSAMTKVIENQVSNGTYISRHLRSGGVDVSISTDLTALQSAVNQTGGRIIAEGDHYHVDVK
jgi:peptidoglycan hydrolase-like protein with peptidoglycan-binding domain